MIAKPLRSTQRLFQIIQILRRTSRPVTAKALAEELEVSTRTIYRDIVHLMGQHVPISGEAGIGYILDAGYDMPPLAFSPNELEAIVLGAQWVAAHGDTPLSRAALDALAKIALTVPETLQALITTPSTAAKLPLSVSDDGVDLTILRTAIRSGKKLQIEYRDQHGALTKRTVWPIILGYSDSTRMLIAWCERRQDFRHFRTDRIIAADILSDRVGERRPRLLRQWEDQRASDLAKISSHADP
nr:YafY family protein [Acetobacter persici]